MAASAVKICVVVGTRPEIIKMAPILRECRERRLDFFSIHSGQHYSRDMDRVFFEELALDPPDVALEVGSGTHAVQTANILSAIEAPLVERRPDVILVEGDTNTVLAAALAASKLGIAIGHVEAGLRSRDRGMPEEINRIMTDHISDYCFAPTETANGNLRDEGIDTAKIFTTGNTVVDAVLQHQKVAEERSRVLERMELDPKSYLVLTAHRQENVDEPSNLRALLECVSRVHRATGLRIVYPVHPRTRRRLEASGFGAPAGVECIEPLGYFDFLRLLAGAAAVLTDSGGVQEETCVLGVPCITLRNNTERPETIAVGSNCLVGTDPTRVVEGVARMLEGPANWTHPYGGGDAAERILDAIASV